MLVSASVLLLALLLIAPTPLVAESPSVIEVAKFSSGTVGQRDARWVEAAYVQENTQADLL